MGSELATAMGCDKVQVSNGFAMRASNGQAQHFNAKSVAQMRTSDCRPQPTINSNAECLIIMKKP